MIYKLIYSIVLPVLRLFFRTFFFVSVKGKEKIPQSGGFIHCANHKSNFDPILLVAFLQTRIKSLSEHIKFLAKRELFAFKPFGYLLKGLGVVPIKRGAFEIGTLKTVISLVKSDNILIMFPEGTRNLDDINKVKSGAVMFAIKGQVPIVPALILGEYRIFRKVKIIYGDPIYYTEYYNKKVTQEELNKLSLELMQKIYALAEESK